MQNKKTGITHSRWINTIHHPNALFLTRMVSCSGGEFTACLLWCPYFNMTPPHWGGITCRHDWATTADNLQRRVFFNNYQSTAVMQVAGSGCSREDIRPFCGKVANLQTNAWVSIVFLKTPRSWSPRRINIWPQKPLECSFNVGPKSAPGTQSLQAVRDQEAAGEAVTFMCF